MLRFTFFCCSFSLTIATLCQCSAAGWSARGRVAVRCYSDCVAALESRQSHSRRASDPSTLGKWWVKRSERKLFKGAKPFQTSAWIWRHALDIVPGHRDNNPFVKVAHQYQLPTGQLDIGRPNILEFSLCWIHTGPKHLNPVQVTFCNLANETCAICTTATSIATWTDTWAEQERCDHLVEARSAVWASWRMSVNSNMHNAVRMEP